MAAPTPKRHPRSPATQPNRNFTRTQTALRAREPRVRTQTATRRYRKTKLGSQITTWRNSESRRLAPDNSNPLRFRADSTCGLASQPTCPDSTTRPQRTSRFKSHLNRRSDFEQPERQEEDDKHKIKPEISASEVRCCYLIFPSIENVQRRRTGLRLASYVGDAGIKISG
jgi:hypothetical protein